MPPVLRERNGPGRGRFLLHHERTFRLRLAAVEFVLFQSVGKRGDLLARYVERFLSPVLRRAGVHDHAAGRFACAGRGVDRVTQPPVLANVREQAGGGAAPENRDGCPSRVEVVGPVRHRVVGEPDVRLRAVDREVIAKRPAWPVLHHRQHVRLPVAKECFDLIAHRLELDRPGDGKDRLGRPDRCSVVPVDRGVRDAGQIAELPIIRAAPRVGVDAASQFDADLLLRVVLNRLQPLPQPIQRRIVLGLRQVRPPRDVGVDRQHFRQSVRDHDG